ncbi:MAG TPA: tRNA preQ1(34) S-adenosylmethionine ribosyltransferase-isomerase QueA [Candidatus Cloacimonetes bacterium]|nr:tRNA preQ1(34) S-adenosylmethionine ribosyltransferase-isomerase QueA [Candidatus Cloacimonadota bacterium]HEX37749.1 tRNA preQ1(34) S-adenosylmethionine ribosyltransferase-isomerase QueA [Candidatus Cloacimonadota bacterium]
MKIEFTLADFDYDLPKNMIAQYPAEKREKSKLMIVNRGDRSIKIDTFENIISYLNEDNILVINETKVIPARLLGRKPTGGKIEVLLLEQVDENTWKCLVKPGRRLKVGSEIILGNILRGKIIEWGDQGERLIRFTYEGNFFSIIYKIGKVPLPPYIKREATELDAVRYQTIFADKNGSVAAPTAGLHFTEDIFKTLHEKGLETVKVNLRIGLDTFRPVTAENIEEHNMHTEYCEIPEESAKKINHARQSGKKVVAVGTTSVRTLESFAKNGLLTSGEMYTNIFIYPGYRFKIVDSMITNFHLPRSTLLMLVSAFAGYDLIVEAYQRAIAEKFRFYSYGDAMLIL